MLKIAIDRLQDGPETVKVNAPPVEFELEDREFEFTSRVRGELEFKLVGNTLNA